MKRLCLLLIISLFAIFNTGYSQEILNSFEHQSSLKEITFSRDIALSISTDFPALGKYSLKAIFPENGGTISVGALSTGNWIRHEVLLTFIWSTKLSRINLRIKDSLDHSFSRVYHLKKGANHLQFKLSNLEGVNVKKIESIRFEIPRSDTLYLDYFALDHYQPRLAKLGRWDVNYSDTIKSSYFSFGHSLPGGPISTYSISPVADGRGIIELAERLDIDHTVTTIGRTSGLNRFWGGGFYQRRGPRAYANGHPFSLAFNYIADDLMFGPEYNVIIWPGLHKWNEYPEQIRNSILKRVKDGAGLVFLCPRDSIKSSEIWDVSPVKPTEQLDYKFISAPRVGSMITHLDSSGWYKAEPHYITRGVPLDVLPQGHVCVLPYQNNGGKVLIKTAKGNPVLAIGTYGKGRVVALAYEPWGLIPAVDNLWETGLHYHYWEYMWSLLARAVRWAAKRVPETFIAKAGQTSSGIYADLSNVIEEGVSLNAKVRDAFGVLEQDTTISLSSYQNHVEVDWDKALHGGKHIATIKLKNDQGIYDWYSFRFSTPQIARIDSIHVDKSLLSVGDEIRGEVVLSSKTGMKGTLIVRLYDNYDRLISKKEYDLSSKRKQSLSIHLPTTGVMSHLARVDAILKDRNEKQIDHKTREIFVLLSRKWDGYKIAMYSFGPNPIPGTWPVIDHQLRNMHVTTLAAYTMATSKHANFGSYAQARIPGVESRAHYKKVKNEYLKTNNKMVLVRKPDLMDPAYLDTVHAYLEQKISLWRKFSPDTYYIFEEASATDHGGVLDLSFSEQSLEAMRTWLKIQYGTLDALNREWETNFKSWESVVPDDYLEAQKRGNYASWADHATFTEKTWADLLKFVQKTVRQYDPDGLVQLSGTQASVPFNGYDYSQIDKYVGQMNTYNIGNQLQFHKDFNPALKLSGGAGYGKTGKDVLFGYYRNLLLGETAGAYIFWQYSALRPDLRLSNSGLDAKKGFDEMRGKGIGKLVGSFKPINKNRIAIEYSMPSVHGTWIIDGIIKQGNPWDHFSDTWDQFQRDRDGWVKILQDAGVGFDFISYSSIADGGLITKGYKTLILPMSYALSDREVKQIRYFVKQGGTLIADALPGIMDGHAKFRKKQALADVFGIKARGFNTKEATTPEHQAGLELRGADALIKDGEIQELVYHQYGRGKSILLNYFLSGYPQEKLNGNNKGSLNKIRRVLDKVGIQPDIRLTDPSGKPVGNITKYVFTNGHDQTQLLGLLPDKNIDNQTITIHLKEPLYLYDIRNEKYLGRSKTFKVNVQPYVPLLFGLVQGRIGQISVSAPSNVNLGQRVDVSFHSNGEGLESLNSVVHIDVYNPQGEKLPLYGGNFNITNSSGSFHFKTALNDPSGKWVIHMKEIMSGVEKKVTIIIH